VQLVGDAARCRHTSTAATPATHATLCWPVATATPTSLWGGSRRVSGRRGNSGAALHLLRARSGGRRLAGPRTGIASSQGAGTGDDGEADYVHIGNIRPDLLAYTYTSVDDSTPPTRHGCRCGECPERRALLCELLRPRQRYRLEHHRFSNTM
jgi:hypothetical protein